MTDLTRWYPPAAACTWLLTECQCLASGHAIVIDNDLVCHGTGQVVVCLIVQLPSPLLRHPPTLIGTYAILKSVISNDFECPAVTKRNIQTRSIARSLYYRQLSFLSCRPCCYTRSELLNQRRNAQKHEILTPNFKKLNQFPFSLYGSILYVFEIKLNI